MALTYEVLTQPDAATVSVVISGLPSDISAANINTEVIDNKVLLFQICGDDDKVQQELQIPLTQAVDADSCAVKLRKKQGSLTFTAAIIKSCSNGQSHVAEVTESLCALQAPSAPHQSAQHGASSAACANGSAEAAQGPAKQASEVPANPASHSNGKEAESKGGGGAKAEPKDLGIAPVIDARYLSVSMSMGLESLQRKFMQSQAAQAKEQEKVDSILQNIVDTLDKYGYAVCDNFISEALVREVRAEIAVMEQHYTPGLIWVGKEAQAGAQISVSDVRGDVVLWLDEQALGATAFIKDGVKRECSFAKLTQMLMQVDGLVLNSLRSRMPKLAHLHMRSDAMMAIYPGKGARFAKHVDNTTKDGRLLTVLVYLNPGWQPEQGGCLRLFPVAPGAAGPVDVLPVAGRLAMFVSDEVAHEVMPAFSKRHSVTLWFYDALEHAEALAASKVYSAAGSAPRAQAQARELLRDMLADTVPGDEEGCKMLSARVAQMTAGALEVVAAVTGAPSTQTFVEQMRSLTPDRLLQLREELRSMGLAHQHHAPDTTAHTM